MNRFIRQAVIGAGITLLLAAGVRAGIVFEQLPNRTGGQSSDTDYLSPSSGQPTWQLLADNVQLAFAADIRRITWWGFYGGDFDEAPDAHDPPTGPETMRIRFYAPRASDGLPDSTNILFEESFLNPSREATGRTLLLPGVPDEYEYVVDLGTPFHLAADTLYWLEISQIGDRASIFRWERGTGLLAGFYFLNPNVSDWSHSPGSFAVQLSTIPEPSTGLLVMLLCTVQLLRSRGRRWAPLYRPLVVRQVIW